MDAGVPIKAPVAGIAMGLVKEGDKVVVLSDIQGQEDFLGDMDFKVAGTSKGITAIQMDMKIKGIDGRILETALAQANKGRMHILAEMAKCIQAPKPELSKFAPKIIMFNINPEKIGEIIGSGGKTINKIIDETGVKIDIEDDGKVIVGGIDMAKVELAKKIILGIITEPEAGMKFTGKVVKLMQFGAFVEYAPGKDGMIHISKMSDKRVEKVEDILAAGDSVEVEVLKVDDRGRVDLKLIKKL